MVRFSRGNLLHTLGQMFVISVIVYLIEIQKGIYGSKRNTGIKHHLVLCSLDLFFWSFMLEAWIIILRQFFNSWQFLVSEKLAESTIAQPIINCRLVSSLIMNIKFISSMTRSVTISVTRSSTRSTLGV